MANLLNKFNQQQTSSLKKNIPKFKAGDTVKVSYRISEGTSSRIQVFEGVVIGRSKQENDFDSWFTVRKISSNIGVERKFPLFSPLVEKIEVVKHGVVRKGKLYYLRNLKGKSARIEEKVKNNTIVGESSDVKDEKSIDNDSSSIQMTETKEENSEK